MIDSAQFSSGANKPAPSPNADNNVVTTSTTITSSTGPADFEEAMAATGYGRFNLLLMLIALPCCMSSVYESACISYILPIAECDLQLSLLDKGILNAIAYAGMITSAIPWGYYADRWGRRKLLIYGLFLDGLCMFASSLSRKVYLLMFFKYLGGFIMCGPFAVLMSYVSEFHGNKYRPSVMMFIGMFFSLATISLPSIGWLILPIPWTLDIGPYVSMRSWQMFLSVCALPGIVGSVGLIFMPESPRFLMSSGRYAEALDVMRTIYAWNTGADKTAYPITQLKDESRAVDDLESECVEKPVISVLPSMPTGLAPIKPLLRKPLLSKAVLVLTIQFCSLFGLNTMRLWLPQLYTIVTDYATWDSVSFADSDYDADLCGMIAYSVNESVTNLESLDWINNCSAANINDAMYMNTIYSGFTGLFGYVLAGFLIKWLGTKHVIVGGLALVGVCGIGMYWATSTAVTVVLSSIYVSLGSICTTAFIGVIVNIFPTSLRTLTISVGMMFGRMGALIGNILFPYLLAVGCLAPFMMVGIIMLISSCLCMLLPKSNSMALK